MNQIDNLDSKQLRKFGLTMAMILIAFFGLSFPFLTGKNIPLWPFAVSAPILISVLLYPRCLNIIYIPWMKLGSILGWINTRMILGIIFFLLITPMGMIMRLRGKDPLQRCYDKNIDSYRKISIVSPPQHMEKPY